MPADSPVDRKDKVFVNSEDGNLYAIRPDGTLRDHLFVVGEGDDD